MASQTLVEAKKFINNLIVQGVVQDVIDINPMYSSIPFTSYTGQAILVNRENALGDAGFYGVDDTITHKSPGTYVQVPFSATKIIGDAEMDGLVQAQSVSAGTDQMGIEISSKAKTIGRLYQQGVATGDGAGNNMNSLHSLVDSGQYTASSAGQALTFELMDEAADLVLSKDGEVDWIMMTDRTMRSYKALLRSLGGSTGDWVINLPDGRTTIGYEGVPIFKNTFLSKTELADGAALTGGALSSVWFGNWDDGSSKVGVAGIYPESVPMGIQVQAIGAQEAKDSDIVRVKQYANFVNFNRKGIARLTSINN